MQQKNNDKKTDIILIVAVGAELLDYLTDNLKGFSRNNIKSMLKRGDITVDGAIVTRHDIKLNEGQRVSARRGNSSSGVKVSRGECKIPPIIYEDEDFIAINKPEGLLTVSDGKEKEKTAYHIVNEA
ncbi:MAG: RluA family pseudouridine synthase, partial [Clostridia bacterium]|nr:RluA family pseudouridine synthase [Clostridia bacterium]